MSEFAKLILKGCGSADLSTVSAILDQSLPHMTGPEMIVVFRRGTPDEAAFFIRKNKASLLIEKEGKPGASADQEGVA